MGRLNFVTRVQSDRFHFGENVGPLSVKSVSKGNETYESEGVRRVVEPDRYLILNDGQRYVSSIESDEPVEAFCVWFRPRFAEQVRAALDSSPDKLLDDPEAESRDSITFVDRLYSHDDLVTPILRRMHRAFNEGWSTRPWLDEQFHLLQEGMLRSHNNVSTEIDGVAAVRRSTRLETYRRLHRAKDHLESNLTVPVSLNDIASVAWLSPHHFLRQFQLLFGETPRQYQTRRRMEKARDLLTRTDQPVTEICFSLGFESLGSFSWLFRRLYGAPPSQYRALHQTGRRENGKPEEAGGLTSC
jgi:AraC family transcriptional regulator